MSLPSTLMWSRFGSALVPSAVTFRPFSVTSPSRIRTSALRRVAMPAAEIIFCSLSWFLMSGSELIAGHLCEFLQGGQFREILQTEMDQKLPGGSVKDRPAHYLLPASYGDQFLL